MRKASYRFRAYLGLFGLLVNAPILCAGAVISSLYIAAERGRTEQQTLAVARDVASAIDRQLDGALAALRTLALSPALEQRDLRSLQAQAEGMVAIFPGSVVALRDASRQQLIDTALPFGTPLPRTQDATLLEADEQALTTGRPAISDLYRGAATKRLLIVMQIPVSFAGEPHLLSLALLPEFVLDTIRSARTVPEDWLVVVIDKKQRILARTRDHARFVGADPNPDFLAMLKHNEGLFTSTTLDGVDVLDGYTRSAATGWIVVAATPLTWLFQPIERALLAVFGVAAIGIFSSIGIALLFGRYITAPIRRLRNDALALTTPVSIEPFSTGVEELNGVSKALAQASASLDTLINELNHRVKNSLASVQAIAQQTLKETRDLGAFKEAFTGRLIALAQSHDMLSDTGWTSVNLRELVQKVCGAHAGERRVRAEGPPVRLSPRATLSMGMILHELCTNAAKYGALSSERGSVLVGWRLAADKRVAFSWTESGGPPAQSPERSGFGTRFIRDSVDHELGGTSSFAFNSEGLVFKAEFPLH